MGIINVMKRRSSSKSVDTTIDLDGDGIPDAVPPIPSADGHYVDVDGDGVPDQSSSGDTAQIVLDGPLSEIYARALDVVYAHEDIAAMSGDDDVVVDSSITTSIDGDPSDGLYVYTVSPDLDLDGVSTAIEAIRVGSKRCRDVLVVMECGHRISHATAVLERYVRETGVRSVMSRTVGMEAIQAYVSRRLR